MQPSLPDDLPSSMPTYRFFAKTYGWTPDQVNILPIDAVEWLPIMERASSEADEVIQEIVNRRNSR